MIGTVDEDECFALLDSTTVGRVGLVHEGRVEIIPVNYRMQGRDVLLRTSDDGILAESIEQEQVAFEVDHHDDLGGTAWSILLSGRLEAMTPAEVAAIHGRRGPLPWAGGNREFWLRYVTERVSGRRVRRRLQE